MSLTPHDAFFKRSLQDLTTAQQLIKQYLPKKILARLDLSTLAICKTECVDKNLNKSAADIVLSVKTRDNQDAYVYILAEHMRYPEKTFAFRLLKYLIHIQDEHLRKHKTHVLPLVFPLIIYNGDRKYPYTTDLFSLYPKDQQDLAKEVLLSPYPLVDLSQVDDKTLNNNPWLGLLLKALKYGPKKKSAEDVVQVLELAIIQLTEQDSLNLVHTTLRYLSEARDKSERNALWSGFKKRLQPILGETIMMSIADELRQEGHTEGRAQGHMEGNAQGMQTKAIEIAKNLLNNGIELKIIAKSTGLSINQLRKLQLESIH